MSQYAAEPVPMGIDPTLAEYLMRQMVGIQNALTNNSIVMEFAEVPDRPIVGAVINVNDPNNSAQNGFWVCESDGQGAGVWKKLQAEIPTPPTP